MNTRLNSFSFTLICSGGVSAESARFIKNSIKNTGVNMEYNDGNIMDNFRNTRSKNN